MTTAGVSAFPGPDLTRWREHRAGVLAVYRPEDSALLNLSMSGGLTPGIADPDAALLVSLSYLLHVQRKTFFEDSQALDTLDGAVLVVPSEGWRRPSAVHGVTLYGHRVEISDRVAWPSLLWELPR